VDIKRKQVYSCFLHRVCKEYSYCIKLRFRSIFEKLNTPDLDEIAYLSIY